MILVQFYLFATVWEYELKISLSKTVLELAILYFCFIFEHQFKWIKHFFFFFFGIFNVKNIQKKKNIQWLFVTIVH